MAKTISKKVKKVAPKKEEENEEEEEGGLAEPTSAKKKIVEIDEPEPMSGAHDEKMGDDDAPVSEDEDDLGDDGIDDDEVDPFGDKWEQ
jgi:hypothetical protein